MPRFSSRRDLWHKVSLTKIKYLASRKASTTSKFFLRKKSVPKLPLKIFNYVIPIKVAFHKMYKNLKIMKYFFRIFKLFSFFSVKKKIFFCYTLINLILNFVTFVKRSILSRKLFVILQILIYYSFSFAFCNIFNFRRKYFTRFMFYKSISKTLFRSSLELIKCDKMNYSITAINKFRFHSSLVLNYILIKLGQYFNIHDIVNPLCFFMKGLTSIGGYKILVRGRLTRKERASVIVRSGKRMPLSSVMSKVDYSQGFKIMKFGVVGIKVYLLMNPSFIFNLYTFNYKYAKIS